MLKPGPEGIVYVIRENNFDGAPTNNYKLGIIRDSERGRTVDQRCDEHRTGNPNPLEVVHTTQTAMVDQVETLAHGVHAQYRVNGEWFHFSPPHLEGVIEFVENAAQSALRALAKVTRANDLANELSDGSIVAPSADTLELHHRLRLTKAMITVCKSAQAHLTGQLLVAQEKEQPKDNWVTTTPKAGRVKFDEKTFANTHPRIHARYFSSCDRVSKSFKIATTSMDEIEARKHWTELWRHLDHALSLRASGTSGDDLHAAYLATLAHETALRWEYELGEAELRCECGLHDQIVGVCSWTRKTDLRTSFDLTRFKAEQEDMFAKFLKPGEPTTEHRVRRTSKPFLIPTSHTSAINNFSSRHRNSR